MGKRVVGEPVSARDVENLEGDSAGTHFVRLCTALIREALVAEGVPSTTLQVTERVNVRDAGVDTEIRGPCRLEELIAQAKQKLVGFDEEPK